MRISEVLLLLGALGDGDAEPPVELDRARHVLDDHPDHVQLECHRLPSLSPTGRR
jgi:hypothetical protein